MGDFAMMKTIAFACALVGVTGLAACEKAGEGVDSAVLLPV